MTLLIQLSETEKRIILALLIIFILVFVLIGLIGSLVVRTMKFQGKRLDNLVSDVVTTRVITNKKQFFPYARKKNSQLFFKQSFIPLLILFAGVAVYLIYDAVIGDFTYNPFNTTNGFGTLFYTFDFNDPSIYSNFFGMTILADWPPIATTPHFVVEAWQAYVSVPLMLVGGIWYLITAQCFLARIIRMHKLSRTIFDKSLEGFNQNTPVQNVQPEQETEI